MNFNRVRKFLVLSSPLLLTFMPSNALADDLINMQYNTTSTTENWRVVKRDNRRKIVAYDKLETGQSLRSFKVEYEVEASLDDIARVQFDFANYPKWFYQVKEAQLIRKVSPTEMYYYIVHRAPATLPDRDNILHATIEPYTKERGYASMRTVASPQYLPPKPPLVRVAAEEITFKWIVLGQKKIKIIIEGHFDPSGFPSWAANDVQQQSAYRTTLGFIRTLGMPTYNNPLAKPLFSLIN